LVRTHRIKIVGDDACHVQPQVQNPPDRAKTIMKPINLDRPAAAQ